MMKLYIPEVFSAFCTLVRHHQIYRELLRYWPVGKAACLTYRLLKTRELSRNGHGNGLCEKMVQVVTASVGHVDGADICDRDAIAFQSYTE